MKTLTEEEYIPFGEEWKNELMKLPKIGIIALYRSLCLKEQEKCDVVIDLMAINEKQVEIITEYKKLLKMNSWKYPTHRKFTDAKNTAKFYIVELESEIQSLQSEPPVMEMIKEPALTEEEAQKCYPDLCFCKKSTYTKGVCDKCGKYED